MSDEKVVAFPKQFPTIEHLIRGLEELKNSPNKFVGAAILYELQDRTIGISLVNVSASGLALGALMMQEEALILGGGDED